MSKSNFCKYWFSTKDEGIESPKPYNCPECGREYEYYNAPLYTKDGKFYCGGCLYDYIEEHRELWDITVREALEKAGFKECMLSGLKIALSEPNCKEEVE